jgi:hypothetical protein
MATTLAPSSLDNSHDISEDKIGVVNLPNQR